MSNSPDRSSARSEIPDNRMVKRPTRPVVSDSSRGFVTLQSTNAGVLAQRCPPTIQLEQEREKIRRGKPEYRDPRNPKFPQPNIFLYIPAEPKFPKNISKLSKKELERRENLIRKSIRESEKIYSFAASQLTHWLDGKGGSRLITKEIFDFTDLSCGVIPQLIKTHLPILRNGAKKRLEDGRLIPGCSCKIWWQSSLVAEGYRDDKFTHIKERDLSVAMHGFQIVSEMEVMARVKELGKVDIIAWKFQIYDSFDWILGAPALIIIPPDIDIEKELYKLGPIPIEALDYTKSPIPGLPSIVIISDTWFLEVEISGTAHWFDSFTEVLEVPKEIVQRIRR